jgi:hypothetical protein
MRVAFDIGLLSSMLLAGALRQANEGVHERGLRQRDGEAPRPGQRPRLATGAAGEGPQAV